MGNYIRTQTTFWLQFPEDATPTEWVMMNLESGNPLDRMETIIELRLSRARSNTSGWGLKEREQHYFDVEGWQEALKTVQALKLIRGENYGTAD